LVLTRTQVRELDRRASEVYGIAGLALMENAGRGVADKLLALGARGPVVVCCGKGNNGGDGFVIARHLDGQGVPVRVLLWGDPAELTGDAAANCQAVLKCGLPLAYGPHAPSAERLSAMLEGAEWIVDALLGTGFTGALRAPLAAAIAAINAHPAPKLAVDLPSGLDADTGAAAEPTIRARHTCTFVAAKPGLLEPGAALYVGELSVLPIGIPRALLTEIASPH
jgi:NAD(P)H-hydrate epimerase